MTISKRIQYHLNIAFSPVLFFTYLLVNITSAVNKSCLQFADAWEQNERYFKKVHVITTKPIGGKGGK